jgi:hypothetical protein
MKKELLFESKVAAKFMQTAGLSEETRRNLIEEMYGAKMDEFGEVYEQEEEMEDMDPEAGDMGPEVPEDVDMGPEAPEDVDMDPEAPEDVGMEPADAEKVKVLADVVKQLSAALDIEDQVEVSGLEDDVEGEGEPAGMEPLKEMGKMHDELEEMDDEVLEETVRAILAK